MEKYEALEMDVIQFENEDVVNGSPEGSTGYKDITQC